MNNEYLRYFVMIVYATLIVVLIINRLIVHTRYFKKQGLKGGRRWDIIRNAGPLHDVAACSR